jgi:hypothetical protein
MTVNLNELFPQFDKPKALEVTVNGVALVAQAKEFSTGSFGFYLGDKVTVRIGETLVKVQLGITATVIGSKEAPADKPVATAA